MTKDKEPEKPIDLSELRNDDELLEALRAGGQLPDGVDANDLLIWGLQAWEGNSRVDDTDTPPAGDDKK